MVAESHIILVTSVILIYTPFFPQPIGMPKSKLYQEVIDKFVEKLNSEESFDEQMIGELRKNLTSDSKIKAADIASIFSGEATAK